MDNLALDGDLKTQTPSESSICAFSTTPNLQLPLSNNSGESATQISTINTLTTSWLQVLRSPSLPSRQITSTEEALQLRASMKTLNTYLQNNATIETQSMVDDLKLAFCPFLEVGFNTYVFYRAFTKADCASDYLLAITAFLRNYYSLSDLQGIVDMILGLDVHIQGKISDNCTYEREEDVKYDDSNIEPQSFGDFSPRKLLDNWKSLSDSELLAKANRVVYGLVSAGLVKQFNLEFTSGSYKIFAERDLHTFKFSSINDLLYKVADLMVTFGETGYECFVERSLAPILVNDRISRTWLKRLQKMYDTHALINLNPNPDHAALLEELDGLIADGQRLMRTENKSILLPFFRPLMDFRADYMAKHSVSSMRRCPWSALIHGPPGIGKTSVSMMIASIYKNVVVEHGIYPNLKWDPKKNLYNRNHSDEYWSGYKGAVHWCIMEDDLAKETRSQLAKGVKDGPLHSIDLVNTVGMATTQANLEDKGKIPLLPKCVLANSNHKGLHADCVLGDVGALLRRYPNVIEPVLKEEFKDPKTGIMIKSEVPITDAWLYKIETVCLLQSMHGTMVQYKPYLPGDNLATGEQLCHFLTKSILAHEKSSAMMEQSMNANSKCTLCVHGVLSSLKCSQCEVSIIKPDPVPPDCEPVESQCDTLFDPYCNMDTNPPIDNDGAIVFAKWLYIGGVPLLLLVSYLINTFLHWIHPKMVRLVQRCICSVVYCILRLTPNKYRYVVLDFLLYWKFLCFGPVAGATLQFLESRVPWEVEQQRQTLIAVAGFCAGYVMMRTTIGAVSITSSAISSKLSSKKSDDNSPSLIPPPIVPQGNIWNRMKQNESFKLPKTTCIGNDFQLISSVKSSIFRLGVICAGESKGEHALAIHIGNGNYLTVNHLFQPGIEAWSCTALLGKSKNNFRNKITFPLMSGQLRRLPGDLVVFSTSAIIPRKSLRDFLPPEIDEAGRRVRSISLNIDGDIEIHDGYTMGLQDFNYADRHGNRIVGKMFDGIRTDKSMCQVGDCGTIYIAETAKGWVIKSMHVAGTSGTSRMISSPISSSFLVFEDMPLHLLNGNETTYFNTGSKRSGPLGPAHDKSISLWCANGDADHIGSFPGRSTSTSSTKETLICSEVCSTFGISNPYTRPLMVPRQSSSGDWLNPYTIAATSQAHTNSELSEQLLSVCAAEYEKPLRTLIKDMSLNVSPLTISEAINGIHGDDYINSLPMSTSGGFLFPGAKRNYFNQNPDTGFYSMTDDVRSKYEEIIECYKRGDRACVLFNGALKDEPVTFKKAEIGKTRVFTACDVAFSIVVRQYYARVAKIIMEYNITSECAVSMNCYSEDWKKIYNHVTTHGTNKIIAGDYKSFDKSMSAVVIGMCFNVLISLIRTNTSLSDDDIQILVGIKTDICFPITNLNGDVVQFFGGNSSGHPLTVIINSIANSLYIRMAYLVLRSDVSDFRSNVSLMTLGDDNIMGSRLDSFNHSTISQSLGVYGVTYTMPDKTSESVPFVDISSVDFLKRRFVRNGSDVIAPLSLDSIFKSLMMEVEKSNISSEERLAQAYLTARREWCLHGKDIFDEYTSKMEKIFDNHEMIRRFCHNPKYKYDYDKTYDWVCGRLEDEPTLEGPVDLDLLDY